MSTNNPTYQKINWGWLNDYNGYKFAPITFVEQLYTEDGFPFLKKYNDNMTEIQTTIANGTINSAKKLVDSNGVDITTPSTQPVYFNNGLPQPLSTINSDVVGNLTGDVIGNLTGNVNGDVTFTNNISVSFTGDATGTLAIAGSNTTPSVTLTLANTDVTAGNYGPSAGATLTHEGTFTVPYISVDSKGRLIGASTKTYTLPAGNKVSIEKAATAVKRYILTNSATEDEAADNKLMYYDDIHIDYSTEGELSTAVLMGAAWNDYAEYRNQLEEIEPGYCVASTNQGKVYKTTEKFQACDGVVSDTFGYAIGKTNECQTPLAVSGRVLVYYNGNREDYNAGDTVCAGPNGKICKMTREEIKEYPDRIIGIVSEIPEYEEWNTKKINNRIWIKVK